MRGDSLRLHDILDAIERHTPASRKEFDSAEPIRSHIMLHVQIIGEAASKLSEQLRTDHPQVQWKSIMRMRNNRARLFRH
jgi:uncharacterized protein with HEPN domain